MEEKRANRTLLALGLALAALVALSFTLGRYGLGLGVLWRVLTGTPLGLRASQMTPQQTVVWNIRLPRILLCCLVGACLASAGACYQGVFQNAMASPDLLGCSQGAAFGAALAILLGASTAGITASAFLFSLVTVALVYLIGQYAPGQKVLNLVLGGVMIGSLFSAGTSFIKLVADPGDQLPAITYWLMGSLAGARMETVLLALVPMLLGLVPLFLLRWKINLLVMGEEEARAMGVHTDRLRLVVVLCATLITASAVSVSGLIGWVGLVVPHLSRMLMGSNYKHLLPCSALFGAGFLLLTDNVSRNLFTAELPIGILTAWIGAPFFIYLMLHQGRGET